MQSKTKHLVIALDAMGGDNAPNAVLYGADLALEKLSNVEFLLFGDRAKLEPLLKFLPRLRSCSKIEHCDDVVDGSEKPSVALRKGKNSSMRKSIDSVHDKSAIAVVSSGNTGALMAMAKLVLRTLPGIDRPAICSALPTKKDKCVMLDLGANVECDSDNLVQFAIMGDAFAKVILGKSNPKVALLNVGTEETKGKEVVRVAADELKSGDYEINFCGFVEPDGIAEGKVDVVVADGFSGNVALKAFEGMAKICSGYVKEAFTANLVTKFGALFVKGSVKKLFSKMDPRLHNGAMFVGLNGIAVKSHGGADKVAFCNAILVAYNLAVNNINKRISDEILQYDGEKNLSADMGESRDEKE